MKKDKRTTIKKAGRLSGFYKDSMVEFLVRELIEQSAGSLSKTQIRRIFSHAYQALRGNKGEAIIEKAQSDITRRIRLGLTTTVISGVINAKGKSVPELKKEIEKKFGLGKKVNPPKKGKANGHQGKKPKA